MAEPFKFTSGDGTSNDNVCSIDRFSDRAVILRGARKTGKTKQVCSDQEIREKTKTRCDNLDEKREKQWRRI